MRAAIVLLFVGASASASIQVPVTFVEALAPRDSTSSSRFQADFEKAIKVAKEGTQAKLKRCGYELATSLSFYDAGDPLQASEKGTSAQREGKWLIVGPRRSNHYLLLAKGSPKTATVSLMASASEITELGTLHGTLAPLNSEMAEIAAREAAKRSRKRSDYLTVAPADCIACQDFADVFREKGRKFALLEANRVALPSELPDLDALKLLIAKTQPRFILLPTYSKTAAHVMAGLTDVFSGFYVGGDGWGDSNFGFVQNGPNLEKISGFAVRGFPPFEKGIAAFPLGRQVKETAELPTSGPALGIIRIVEAVSDILCTSKPKTADAFGKAFGRAKSKLHSPWGVSIYELKGGSITFARTTRTSSK